jgi:beta-phosphoglucomutase
MAIRAVIFDMDGVLIDSAAAHYQSWCRLAAELGRQVTPEQFSATFGRQNRDIIPLLFGEDLDADRVVELGERKEALYRDLVRGCIPAIEGAVDLARGCHRAGMKLAVGSSGHPLNIKLALDELGIAGIVETVVHGGEVSRGKPDPQVFLLAAERLAVEPPACAVIEDAPSGIDAALAAGMAAIGITTQHPAERLAHAHRIVDRLAELDPLQIASMRGGGDGAPCA